jgi:hypothetical protein
MTANAKCPESIDFAGPAILTPACAGMTKAFSVSCYEYSVSIMKKIFFELPSDIVKKV